MPANVLSDACSAMRRVLQIDGESYRMRSYRARV
jgi:hypothetical protein